MMFFASLVRTMFFASLMNIVFPIAVFGVGVFVPARPGDASAGDAGGPPGPLGDAAGGPPQCPPGEAYCSG